MSDPILALELLYDYVRELFASESSTASTPVVTKGELLQPTNLVILPGSWQTATPGLATGTPDGVYAEILVEITQGFLAGVSDGAYRYSTDGGNTWSNHTVIAPATSLPVHGAIIDVFNGPFPYAAANQGDRLTFAIVASTGTSTITLRLPAEPNAAASVIVDFEHGGTVGTAGITYRISLDDGATWGSTQTLGTATSIGLLNVFLDLSAGTIVAGDQVAFTTTVTGIPSFVFGHREVIKQTNQGPGRANRVVFDPFDSPSEDGPPRDPGQPERPLATLEEGFNIYCWARDASAPRDELAQWRAARLLYDAVRRAIYLATTDEDVGTPVAIKSFGWVPGPPGELPFGAEIKLGCRIASKVPDAPYTLVTTNLELIGSIGDVDTETITSGPEGP